MTRVTYHRVCLHDLATLVRRLPPTRRRIALDITRVLSFVTVTMFLGCRHQAPTVRAPSDDQDETMQILDQAERTVAVAAGDCARACQAVREMRHATAASCRRGYASCTTAQSRTTTIERDVAVTCDVCP